MTASTFSGMMNPHTNHKFDLTIRQEIQDGLQCYYDVWCTYCEVILIPDVRDRQEADDWVEEMTAWVKAWPYGYELVG